MFGLEHISDLVVHRLKCLLISFFQNLFIYYGLLAFLRSVFSGMFTFFFAMHVLSSCVNMNADPRFHSLSLPQLV